MNIWKAWRYAHEEMHMKICTSRRHMDEQTTPKRSHRCCVQGETTQETQETNKPQRVTPLSCFPWVSWKQALQYKALENSTPFFPHLRPYFWLKNSRLRPPRGLFTPQTRSCLWRFDSPGNLGNAPVPASALNSGGTGDGATAFHRPPSINCGGAFAPDIGSGSIFALAWANNFGWAFECSCITLGVVSANFTGAALRRWFRRWCLEWSSPRR